MSLFSRRRFLQLGGLGLFAGAAAQAGEPAPGDWLPLFDGTLKGWKAPQFAGQGEVTVEGGRLILDAGNDLTGLNRTGELPKINYEVVLEATRLAGSDFFCALTLPYGETCCTLVVGGWGGGLVGISSIDGADASENETTSHLKFEDARAYRIRIRMTPATIEAWIDDQQVVKLATAGKKIGMRSGEIELSQPFGLATFRTRAAFRAIRIRRL